MRLLLAAGALAALVTIYAAPAAFAQIVRGQVDAKPIPSGGSISMFAAGDSITTVVFDPNEEVRRIVLFTVPPLARVMGGGAKSGAMAPAVAAVDAEHARFRADVAALETGAGKSSGGLEAATTEFRHDYRAAVNGVAVTTRRWVADRMAALPYVQGVYEDRTVRAIGGGTPWPGDPALSHGAASHGAFAAPMPGASALPAAGTHASLAARAAAVLPARAAAVLAARESVAAEASAAAGGSGVVIAIIDTGVDYTHPALGGGFGPGFRVIGGYDFIDDDADPMDEHGHGTHVAGIAAGNAPDGFRGVAPEASLLAYRVLDASGYGHDSGIIAAIERSIDPDGDPGTDDRAHILNMSLGGDGHPDDPLAQAVDNVTAAGILSVVAAGNNGRSFGIDSPGVARTALTVGAVNYQDALADFSSRGPVSSTFENKPDLVAPGVQITSSVPGGGYLAWSGTSMAAPFVAGVAAVIMESRPGWSPEEVKSALMLASKDTYRTTWEQGAGRIDGEAAAALPALVYPASISFGNLDPTEPGATFERTLTVRNVTASVQTFAVSVENTIQGAAVTASPSTLTIPAGGTGTITVAAVFETARVPFPGHIDIPFAGRVTVSGAGTTLAVPFTVTKTPVLVLRYDVPPFNITVLNERGGIAGMIYPGEVVTFPIAAGTYDVLSTYNMLHGDRYTTGLLVNEQVTVAGKHELQLSEQDVRHVVTLDPRDTQGRTLPVQYQSLRFTHIPSGYTFISSLVDAPVLLSSNMSGRFKLEALLYSLAGESGADYVVPLLLEDGVQTSVTVTNDQAAFREVRTRYQAPPGTTELFVVPITYARLGRWGMSSYSWYGEDMAEHHRLGPPFERSVFHGINPSDDFGFPHRGRAAYNTSGGRMPEPGPDGNLLAVTPAIHPATHRTDFFAHPNFRDAIRTTTEQVFDDWSGSPPLLWGARMQNVMDELRFNSAYRAGLFHNGGGDVAAGTVAYTLFRNGSALADGVLVSGLDFNLPIKAEPGRYGLRLGYDGAWIEGHPVRADVRLEFDTRSGSGQTDPDPPSITRITLQSGGVVGYELDPSKESSITAVLLDPIEDRDRPVSTAEIFVRRLGETDWIGLPAARSDAAFTSAWPASLPSGYYGLRVTSSDPAGNTLDYATSLSFRAGKVEGNTAPAAAALHDPEDRLTIELDTLSAPVRFRWHPATDPDAGQELRYVFRIHGEAFEHTVATSDTSVSVDLAGRLAKERTYTWTVETTDGFVVTAPASARTLVTMPPSVNVEPVEGVPGAFALLPNYPNPFNPSTQMRFDLPAPSHVRLEVFDMTGRLVERVVDAALPAGSHSATWDAGRLPSGVYAARLVAGGQTAVRLMVLQK